MEDKVEDITSTIVAEEKSNMERDRVYNEIKGSRYYAFKDHLDVDLNTDLSKYDIFKNNIKIVHTWKRMLTEGSQVHLTVTEHIRDGINMNQFLDHYKTDSAPLNHFFIIEYFGDRKGNIKRNCDGDMFSGYTPTKIDYRLSNEITYIKNTGSDLPICLPFTPEDKSFDDKVLEDEFYPNRKDRINVDIEKISLSDSSNPDENTSFTLMYNASVTEKSAVELLKQKLEEMGVDKNVRDSVTEDDLIYNETFEANEPEQDDIIDLDSEEYSKKPSP